VVDRYPFVLYIGSAVLAWTAGGMVADEPMIHKIIADSPWISYAIQIILIVIVLVAGGIRKQRKQNITRTIEG
jgi:predicted tellurium resistance membrane protein TerC